MLEHRGEVRALIELAKREDLGAGDATTALLADAGQPARFTLLAKQNGVLAGCAIGAAVLRCYDDSMTITWTEGVADGCPLEAPATTLADIRGPLGAILAAERVLLNFLQRLCGVATLTKRFVDAVKGTNASILDTRKTTPGWRVLDKYAVRCGGGVNHRFGLHDAVLIKDNHLTGMEPERLAAAVFEMLSRLPADREGISFVEVEVDALQQLDEVLKVVGIDVILLDNFSLDDLAESVRRRDALGLAGKVALEASGGITLDNVRAIAETGVDRISVGALTHSAASVDLAMERVE